MRGLSDWSLRLVRDTHGGSVRGCRAPLMMMLAAGISFSFLDSFLFD